MATYFVWTAETASGFSAGDKTAVDDTHPLPVTLAGAGSGVSDPTATTGSITAADVGSTTSSGASGQTVIAGTATAASTVPATLSGHTSYTMELTGTWVGTVQVDKSSDGGTTWVTAGATRTGQIGSDSSMTTNGVWHGNAAALTQLRVRCTAYTSGTVTVRIQPGYGVGTVPVSILSGNVNNNLLSAGIATRLCYPTVAGSATLEKTKWPGAYTLSPATLPVVGSGISGVTALTEAAAVVGGVFSPGAGWGGVLLDFAAVSGADATMIVEIGKLTATACMPQKIASVSLKTITTSGTFTANFDPFTGAAQATTTFRLFDLATITTRSGLGQLLANTGGTEDNTPCQLFLDVSDAPFFYVLVTTLGVTGPVTICITPVA